MKTKYFSILVLLNLVLLLFFFNKDIIHKEETLKNGQLILLKLAPVDPRSLMQGDYMRLNYEITSRFRYSNDIPNRGYLILVLDEHNVGKKIRFQTNLNPLKEGEIALHYYYGHRQPILGAESYFFQEGTGKKYDKAKYGGIIIDAEGNGILTGLYDGDYNIIE